MDKYRFGDLVENSKDTNRQEILLSGLNVNIKDMDEKSAVHHQTFLSDLTKMDLLTYFKDSANQILSMASQSRNHETAQELYNFFRIYVRNRMDKSDGKSIANDSLISKLNMGVKRTTKDKLDLSSAMFDYTDELLNKLESVGRSGQPKTWRLCANKMINSYKMLVDMQAHTNNHQMFDTTTEETKIIKDKFIETEDRMLKLGLIFNRANITKNCPK